MCTLNQNCIFIFYSISIVWDVSTSLNMTEKKSTFFQHKHSLKSLDFSRDDITIWNDIIVQHDRSIVFFYLVCYKHNPRSLDFARDDFVIVILKVLSFRACREISNFFSVISSLSRNLRLWLLLVILNHYVIPSNYIIKS